MGNRRSIVILAEGKFSPLQSKTANQAIRYIPEEVVGVIDSTQAGMTAQDVLGFGGAIPVLPDLRSSLSRNADTLLIGIAPMGGRLPDAWRNVVHEAIDNKFNVISGLHTYLSDDADFVEHATRMHVQLLDLRKVSREYDLVAAGHWRKRKPWTILTVGTDCNVGKMTASLELHREFERRGLRSDFVPTGQTGILLAGKGVAVDSVLSDYIAGAVEMEIERSVHGGAEYIHVEGQGSLTHQGYSGVTLGLMHGVMPDAMIMVHHPIRHRDDYGFPIDDVRSLNDLHERIIAPFKVSKVVGIAINTIGMSKPEIDDATTLLERETNLPVANVLTPERASLATALLDYLNKLS